MRQTLLLAVLVACASGPANAEIYRHVDKDGRVTFTDQPPEDAGAVAVELSPINRLPGAVKNKAAGNMPAAAPPPASSEAREGYESLSIYGVTDGAELRNPTEPLVIGAQLSEPLQAGHTLVILYNGAPVSTDDSHTYTIPRIERGTHTFAAEVRDSSGEIVISSSPATIYVQRTAAPPARVIPR